MRLVVGMVGVCVIALVEPDLRPSAAHAQGVNTPGIAVLQVDTDRRSGTIDRRIYGQFLEHINHSVVDGLFAEQIRGAGFEGLDFQTYWSTVGPANSVSVADVPFERGTKSVRLAPGGQTAGIRQDRLFIEDGADYDGSVWVKVESGAPQLSLRVLTAGGGVVAAVPLAVRGSNWQEVPFVFASTRTDRNATVEVSVSGRGAVLVDFLSLMRADVRRNGALRPLARRVLRVHLQVAGRHRPARLTRLPPERAVGRLLGLLRLRH